MSQPQVRRWFNFSLRMLFVVMTLICCYLGWQSSIVRKRQALLREIKGSVAYQVIPALEYANRLPPGGPIARVATIPTLRSLLGDQAVQVIWIHPYTQDYSKIQRDRLAKTFPEAELQEVLPEPCHPGCFPRGTLVETPDGARAIETIQLRELLTTVDGNGNVAAVPVQSIFVTTNRLLKVETDAGTLYTTQTQPLCRTIERIVAAGDLLPGDTILAWGQGHAKGQTKSVKVIEVTRTSRDERVFNLVLGNSEIFIAGGYLARSKPPAETNVSSIPTEASPR
jgi:hypothetical protein